MILEIVFWISVILIFHTYVFYPVILKVLSRGRGQNQDVYAREGTLPFVSVIIAAFNEEKVIGDKVRSIYRNRYPADRLEVLIGSDASSDATGEIVARLQEKHPSLHFYGFAERRGKPSVVNDLVAKAGGEILLLTDANVIFDEDTIYQTVKHFKNQAIGLVDTNMINLGLKKDGISHQEKAYISREVAIKNREGIIWGAMMGPFGGCYAIRREDFKTIPSNFLVDDFYVNMAIFEKGKLAINEPDARVFEEIPDDLKVEFRRKIRIGTGNWQNLRTFRGLLFSTRYGFAFWSHKVIRWIGPFLMLLALAANVYLATRSGLYLLILIVHLAVMLLPLLDFILKKLRVHLNLLRLATHFYSMNLALFIGFFRSFRAIRSGIWERTKRE